LDCAEAIATGESRSPGRERGQNRRAMSTPIPRTAAFDKNASLTDDLNQMFFAKRDKMARGAAIACALARFEDARRAWAARWEPIQRLYR